MQIYTLSKLHVKFHWNPLSGVGGDALTSYVDRRTDRQTDRMIPIYPPNYVCRGYKYSLPPILMLLTNIPFWLSSWIICWLSVCLTIRAWIREMYKLLFLLDESMIKSTPIRLLPIILTVFRKLEDTAEYIISCVLSQRLIMIIIINNLQISTQFYRQL